MGRASNRKWLKRVRALRAKKSVADRVLYQPLFQSHRKFQRAARRTT